MLEDPFPDPEGLARFVPEKSPPPTEEQLKVCVCVCVCVVCVREVVVAMMTVVCGCVSVWVEMAIV